MRGAPAERATAEVARTARNAERKGVAVDPKTGGRVIAGLSCGVRQEGERPGTYCAICTRYLLISIINSGVL